MTMTLLPRGLKVHLALGYTDMRKGVDGLAMLVQAVLRQDPFSGHLFVFRGRKANLIKIVYWDGTGLCLFTKRLEQGVFLWPPDVDPGETVALSSEQLSMLIDGVDWRAPERWATVCSLIASAKLNDVEPFAYLRDTLQRMTEGHPMSRLDELLPWNWPKIGVKH